MYLKRRNLLSISSQIIRRKSKMKKSLVLLFASTLILSSCAKSNFSKGYDPYEERREQEILNTYEGGENEYHLSSWYSSDFGPIEVDETSEETNVTYSKTYGYEYCSVYTTVMGRFADFTYINFLAKGTAGRGISFRLYYGDEEDEEHNALGGDTSFSLTDTYELHSLKVKGVLHSRMDLLTKVSIYPEIGLSGSSIRGSFSFKDVYFSKELPENSTLENPGVDTGDASVRVNGWRTEGWTLYTLYNDNGNTGVSYSKAADWGFIEKEIDIKGNDNALRFSFKNIVEGNNPSVTCIHFMLRGDVSRHVSEGVEYEYDEYYEAPIYTYDLTKEDEVQPDSKGVTTLEMSLETPLLTIGEHHENGYRLTVMIESHPSDTAKYRFNKNGHMLITGLELYHGDFDIDLYSKTGDPAVGSIELKDKEGVEKNIVYNGVSGSAYWPRVNRQVLDATHDSVIKITIRNNGENTVRVGIHAGNPNDSRSDALNNNFYPLWKNQGKSGDYFADGEDVDIAAGASVIVSVSVDTDNPLITSEDKITLIQFLVDNNYGDSTLGSGNIDIVSVVIE